MIAKRVSLLMNCNSIFWIEVVDSKRCRSAWEAASEKDTQGEKTKLFTELLDLKPSQIAMVQISSNFRRLIVSILVLR